MKRVLRGGLPLVFAAVLFQTQAGHAAIVAVNNSDFELPGNAGSVTGIFGNATQVLGSGPWSASSTGATGLLGPTLAVVPGVAGGTDGVAFLTGLGFINIIPVVTNRGEFFQSLGGVSLQPNTTYRLSADVTTSFVLSLSLLANSGIGIGAGTTTTPDLFKSTTAPAGTVTLVSSGVTGRLSFQFTTSGTVPNGDVRLRLYAGDYEGITTITVLPSVTFDEVVFEVIPEPSAAALLLAGCLGVLRRRRPKQIDSII
jgi:hypothetical protein